MKKTYIVPSQEVINMCPEALMLDVSRNTSAKPQDMLSNEKTWNNKSIWDNE